MLEIPTELLEMQTWFANIITSHICEYDDANIPIYSSSLNEEIRKKIAPSPTLKSEERLGIYNQQYWWRIIEVIQQIYPSLICLFDYEDFNQQIAEPYLLDCPPKDWFLSSIGWKLPEWLKKNYREKDAPLVLELARIDLAYEKLMFAEILPKIEPDRVADCETKRLYLQPFVIPFEMKADLFTFRTQLLKHPSEHWLTNDFPPIIPEKKWFVLHRKNERDFYEEISPARFTLLSRFQKGAKLADIIPLLEECDDVIQWFQTLSARGWLSFINPKRK